MKAIYFLSTRIRTYWVLAPMIVILYLCVTFNGAAKGFMKLYPLIVFSALAIIFTFIYLFRVIKISYSEIKYIGLFSSRDSATVNAGKTLVLDLLPGNKVSIKLYGNEGYNPDIKWLQNEENAPSDICLFRGKTFGGIKDVESVLAYFGVGRVDFSTIIETDGFEASYKNVTVSSLTELEHRQIRIRIEKTV